MRTDFFFAVVHMDRFSDLALVIGDHPVTVAPWMMNGDMVMVRIDGEEELVLKLESSIARIRHVLSVAPVAREV